MWRSVKGSKCGPWLNIFLPWKKHHGDRNRGCYVSRKEIIILSFITRWKTHRRYNHLGILEWMGVIYEEESEVAA